MDNFHKKNTRNSQATSEASSSPQSDFSRYYESLEKFKQELVEQGFTVHNTWD